MSRPVFWGRILGQNPDKSLKSSEFPPCYSQSSAALPWDLYFFKLTQPLIVSLVRYCTHTLYRRKEENLIENHTPSLWFKNSIQKPQVWELSRICLQTSTKLYFMNFASVFGFNRARVDLESGRPQNGPQKKEIQMSCFAYLCIFWSNLFQIWL